MAILLAERAVNAVISVLQTNLATELTAIDTERGDGVTLAAPANGNYYNRPKTERAGDTVHVEVFEDGFEFDTPYSDADALRVTFTVPINIRFTIFNRDLDLANQLIDRMRRYQSAAVIVLLKNADLGDSDDATKIAGLTSATPHWEPEGEESDKVFKVTGSISVDVKCEETIT